MLLFYKFGKRSYQSEIRNLILSNTPALMQLYQQGVCCILQWRSIYEFCSSYGIQQLQETAIFQGPKVCPFFAQLGFSIHLRSCSVIATKYFCLVHVHTHKPPNQCFWKNRMQTMLAWHLYLLFNHFIIRNLAFLDAKLKHLFLGAK